MSHQSADTAFATHLQPLLEQLAVSLVGVSAAAPTHHYLARLYARGIIAFSAKFYASSLPATLRGTWSFCPPIAVQPLTDGTQGAGEAAQTLQMDFENYTLGRLFDDRRNYDSNHAGHQAAVAHLRGVVWALGWRSTSFQSLDNRIAEDVYRYSRDASGLHAERYGKKYGWIGYFTYAGLLDARGLLPRGGHRLPDVDIDPSFPETPPTDGDASVPQAWLSPTLENHESWIPHGTTSIPRSLIRREKIRDESGPWIAVHGLVKTEDRVLGREVWAFISALVTDMKSAPGLAAALRSGTQPLGTRDIPSNHYLFCGEIPWHPQFAHMELAEGAYREHLRIAGGDIEVEVLAHECAWESYHSEMNQAGNALVPSRLFSSHFDLRGASQTFDQFLPDGSRATITLGGVDGLTADILYVREDLLRRYVKNRALVWYAFGARELRPYPPTPPAWLVKAQQQRTNEWREVITEADLNPSVTLPKTIPVSKRRRVKRSSKSKSSAKSVSKKALSKTAKKTKRTR